MPAPVVYDTNVWVAGLLTRGKAYRCLLLARTGIVSTIFCSEMAAELSEKSPHDLPVLRK